ncbi:hypothetical protein J7T55_007255 [Diaporthe amygdali]|uniref:uncharacterized protein n=1 Tax=Phomopsis amygdali TaxID=1214568 RepID=UPI0022FE741F|nr:uncharacterized protein J7T55_007255 [Diaporthe amygdali]KAJ0108136.1 hypothetical protein J7T55_007255 [Diaporthe amygdali]
MPSTKYGSGSGGGDDPFKNSTSGSMSKKLKEPKKKRGDSKKKEEEQSSNRESQRAYRERRERRLTELELQVQEAEVLNQTLTTAYQELKAEIDRLQAEKAQEAYYASMAAQAGPSYDASYAGSSSGATGYEQQGDPNLWAYDSNWVPEEWDDGGNGNQQY